MKEFLGKHKLKIVLCIITGLVLVFGVPIVINWAYEQPAILPAFAMSWDAKDALGFYGALLGSGVGAFATIFVLY